MNSPTSLSPVYSNSDISQEAVSGLRTAHVIYLLQALALFTGISLIPAILIGLVKKGEIKQSWLKSHYRWQLVSSLNALLWTTLGILLLEIVIGYFVLIWIAAWYCSRLVTGWHRLAQGKDAYQ